MPSKKHRPEEIIGKLREAEVVLAQGALTAEACRRIAISEQTFGSRNARGMAALPSVSLVQGIWRSKTDQARRKDLEKENVRLRRAISDFTLDKLILQEAARGNF